MTSWFAAYATLPGGLARDVRFDVHDGRYVRITENSDAKGAERLPGVVMPGFANCHSHAFHRALRGRTHGGGGTFWTWREQMYRLAGALNPETYLSLARAAYAEMALAGVTSVGEFHYLHHSPSGRPYADPNAMAEALRQAANEAGVRLTLIDACYLRGGLDANGFRSLDHVQRRFADQDADAWAQRVEQLSDSPDMRVAVAIHSVRAVPREAMGVVRDAARERPLHVHLSEQPAENAACLAWHGATPAAVLDEEGVLGTRATAVHATHLTPDDIALLGQSSTTCCLCPTTERDLADGIGPAGGLVAAGAPLSVGSDQHAVIDLFEEARGLETHERLATGRRGHFTSGQLLDALTQHRSIGWPDVGRLEVGARADLVAVRLDTVRTAGCDPAQVIFAATSADVDTVLVGGRVVVREGAHRLGGVAAMLDDSISAISAMSAASGIGAPR